MGISLAASPRFLRGLLFISSVMLAGHASAQTQSPLIKAIESSDLALARTLLDKGADPNGKDSNGAPLLSFAVKKGSAPLTELLLSKGAKVNAKGTGEQTALILACKENNLPLARILLENGANPNMLTRLALQSAGSFAIDNGNMELLRVLIDKRADVNLAGLRGDTPLIQSIRATKPKIVAELLKRGAKVDMANADGETPLMVAAGKSDASLVSSLLSYKADVSLTDQHGQSALFYAVRSGSPECLQQLVDAGANVNLRDRLGRTPMMVANGSSAAAMIDTLVKLRMDINARDKFGATALMRAARQGDREVVAVLLAKGADTKLTDSRGRTASWRANAAGCTPAADLLNEKRVAIPASPVSRAALIQDTIRSSVKLLESSASGFRDKVGGTCFSCHNQSQVQYALGIAKNHGFVVDTKNMAADTKLVYGIYAKSSPEILKALTAHKRTGDKAFNEHFPGAAAHAGYGLLGLYGWNVKRDIHTEAVARYLSYSQEKDGHWQSNCSVRAPSELSNFTETALALFALRNYVGHEHALEAQPAINRGRTWLETATPKTTEDLTFQLLGVVWAGAEQSSKQVASMVMVLRAAQKADGGWAQEDGMASDAYATGEVLVALHTAGGVAVDDPTYRKGVDFLLRTAEEDGSWFVRSRALPFQGFIETGYPYRHDQFISISAACWATAALALTEPVSASKVARK